MDRFKFFGEWNVPELRELPGLLENIVKSASKGETTMLVGGVNCRVKTEKDDPQGFDVYSVTRVAA